MEGHDGGTCRMKDTCRVQLWMEIRLPHGHLTWGDARPCSTGMGNRRQATRISSIPGWGGDSHLRRQGELGPIVCAYVPHVISHT